MESKDTEESKVNTSRYMVTYTIKESKFATPERITQLVEGDLAEWHFNKGNDCIIEFAIYLWD